MTYVRSCAIRLLAVLPLWLALLIATFLATLAAACSAEATPTATPTPAPAELLQQSHDAMTSENFTGFLALTPEEYFDGADAYVAFAPPNWILFRNLSEAPYLLTNGKEEYFSINGSHWLFHEDEPGYGLMGVWLDPRLLLTAVKEPQMLGSETIDGQDHVVVKGTVDSAALVENLPSPSPSLTLTTSFPGTAPTDVRTLEELGYEVTVAHVSGGTTWLLRKPGMILRVGERPASGPEETSTVMQLSATLRDLSELTDAITDELSKVLEQYGGHRAVLDEARVRSQEGFNIREEMQSVLADATVRLWIDVDTKRLKRFTTSIDQQETALSFSDFGTTATLSTPELTMPSSRSNLLEQSAQPAFGVLRQAIEAYRERNGRYPDDVTPVLLGPMLAELDEAWPINPFSGRPIRNESDSPGDVRYETNGLQYELALFGWGHGLTSTGATLAGDQSPTPTPQPSLANLSQSAPDFPTYVLGEGGRGIVVADTLPELSLALASRCAADRACVWPVGIAYSIEAPESRRAIRILQRARTSYDDASGEATEVAGKQALVEMKEQPLFESSQRTAWQATVWFPDSVVFVIASSHRDRDGNEGNPYNTEAAVRAVVGTLRPLAGTF